MTRLSSLGYTVPLALALAILITGCGGSEDTDPTTNLGRMDSNNTRTATEGMQYFLDHANEATPQVVEKVVERSREAEDADVRGSAMTTLGEFAKTGVDEDRTLNALLEGLDDPDPMVRLRVYQQIDRIGPKASRALPTLLDHLGREQGRQKEFVIRAIGGLQAEAAPAVNELIALLDDPDGRIRSRTCRALWMIGPSARAAVSKLTTMLKHDDDPDIKEWSASALGVIAQGDSEVAAALRTLADTPTRDAAETGIQDAAKEALDQIEGGNGE